MFGEFVIRSKSVKSIRNSMDIIRKRFQIASHFLVRRNKMKKILLVLVIVSVILSGCDHGSRPPLKFKVGDKVKTVLDGREGMIVDWFRSGCIDTGDGKETYTVKPFYAVRFATKDAGNVSSAAFEGHVQSSPYVTVRFLETELEKVDKG